MKYLFNSILPSVIMLMADTATATAGAPKAAGKVVGGPAPSPAPTAGGPAPTPAATKVVPEATPHPKLLEAIKGYDSHIREAETYYVSIIELVLENKINRADVVATLMKARGISFETAQSQYSRMKKMWENPDVLQKLKNGEITLKVAREMTKTPQAATVAGAATTGSSNATTETKEARYERARKAHVAAIKECGFDKKSAMLSFEADLNAAQIK